ncbi:MAG: mechanosensitive ion channel, partial [Chloroflexi bacterium]|nr:mechanosensitive ion channel [Chloroflexota bacterium]
PSLIGAILFLFIGWLVALILSAAVRAILKRTTLDNRLAASIGMGTEEAPVNTETAISKGVFWLVMLFVLVGFFEFLGLTVVTAPLNNLLNQVVGFGSNLLAAGVLALIAWALATFVRFITRKLLGATSLDDKLSAQAGLAEEGQTPLSEMLANVFYWFIFLMFLPAILGALNMRGLLDPIEDMVAIVLAFLPNLFAAGLLILVGWLIARLVAKIVTNLAAAAGADKLGERIGLTTEASDRSLSEILGLIVYVLILIPAIIAGLGALQIAAISDPATEMLATVLNAIPALFWAAVILAVTYVIAKLVSDLVVALLTGIGFNKVLSTVGIGADPKEGQWTPAQIVGYLILVGLMLLAAIEAAQVVGFTAVALIVGRFFAFALQVLLALVILWLGLFLANIAYKAVLGAAGVHAKLLAGAARIAIIIFAATLALREAGIGEEIVNMAFGISLLAIALAVGLAFGLGSRETAGREVESILTNIRSDDGDE